MTSGKVPNPRSQVLGPKSQVPSLATQSFFQSGTYTDLHGLAQLLATSSSQLATKKMQYVIAQACVVVYILIGR